MSGNYIQGLPKLVFIDINSEFQLAIESVFSDVSDFVARTGRIEHLPREDTAFVSPANSLCFMDGGIDHTLSRKMFPDLEKDVKATLKSTTSVSLLGRPYLGLGSTITVRVSSVSNTWVIVSPTMLLPQDVSGTDNAYTSMLAILRACVSHNMTVQEPIRFCVIPALCCGYGKMNARRSAAQCRRAFDHLVKFGMQEPVQIVTTPTGVAKLYPCQLDDQPKYYENREFFEIRAEDIVRAGKSTGKCRVYLAGPECFSNDFKHHYDFLKQCCIRNGLIPVVPLDEDDPVFDIPIPDRGRAVAKACLKVMRTCQVVLANVSPFRGIFADPGTCVEIGYAASLQKPIFAWTDDTRPLIERMKQAGLVAGHNQDVFGCWIEDMGLPDNCMIHGLAYDTFGSAEDASLAISARCSSHN